MKPEELPPSVRQWIRDVLEKALEQDKHDDPWCMACDDCEGIINVEQFRMPEPPWVYDNEIRKFAKWLEDL